MNLISDIPVVGDLLFTVVSFLIVLSIVVFVHEFGHYIVGRWCGIKAEVFSIGFGKRIWHWRDRRGTQWQVAALPLGGFVKFAGDMDPASAGAVREDGLTPEERRQAFHFAGLGARTLTVAAGPVANFLLSIVIFAGVALAVGRASHEPVVGQVPADAPASLGLEEDDRIVSVDGTEITTFGQFVTILRRSDGAALPALVKRDGTLTETTVQVRSRAKIDDVTPGMPAARAGILPGDVITAVNGRPVQSFHELQLITAALPHGEPITVTVDRGGETLDFTFTPEIVTRTHPDTGERVPQPTMGITWMGFSGLGPERVGLAPHEALLSGTLQTWRILSGTVIFLRDMVFAGADTGQLGGPIRIAQISGEKAAEGAMDFFWLIAVLSPIPVLDGGHLMFYAFEGLRGRPLGETWMKIGNMIGLSLVLFLMMFATYNDIVRL